MAKKRKPEAARLEEAGRATHSSFCGAANALSQLYAQAMAHQKIAFHAGERHALEKIYQWIWDQREEGSSVAVADVVAYLQVSNVVPVANRAAAGAGIWPVCVTNFSLHPIVKQIEWIPADNKQVISPQEEMRSNRKTVDELLAISSHDSADIKYTCEATIIDIDASHGWWYKACYYCRAAVKTSDDTICCQHCSQNDQSPVPWYKLSTIVEDGSGIACFTIFGRLAQELVHFPAHYLATMATSDKYSIPPLIKSIIGQKHIFQLMSDSQQFSTGLTSFRVTKIFTIDYNVKGKRLARETLLIKNEEEIDPSIETSSSSNLPVENVIHPPQDSNSLGGNEHSLENKTVRIKNEEKLNPSTKKTSRDNDSQTSETSGDKIYGDPGSLPGKKHCPSKPASSNKGRQ